MDVNNSFDRLRNFLLHEMRMSHVYQPVMIRELLRRGGTASTEAIARALLAEDRAQVDYYRLIVRNMGDTIAVCPPLIISEAEVDELFTKLGRALDRAEDLVQREGLRG